MSHLRSQPRVSILAVDDEAAILFAIKAVLENESYVVHTASSPTEALRFYEQHWRGINLVLLDFSMPEMTGDLVYLCLQQINPEVRVLLVTATGELARQKMAGNRVCGCVPKPFHLAELVRGVRDALGSTPVPAPLLAADLAAPPAQLPHSLSA